MFRMPRLLVLSLLCFAAVGGVAQAADYPTGRSSGSSVHAGGHHGRARAHRRAVADREDGPAFIVENKPGAGNNLGTEYVVNAPPDGYTMLLVNPANGINATLYKHLTFNFIRDIAPVAGIVRTPNVMEVTRSCR